MAQVSKAQTWYWIEFTNKDTAVDMQTIISSDLAEAKQIMGYEAYDWYDIPVTKSNIDQVSAIVDSVYYVLNWFNATVVFATDEQVDSLKTFGFVKRTYTLEAEVEISANAKRVNNNVDKESYKRLNWQINTLEGHLFKERGITGKGIRIAVLDVGFKGFYKVPQLKSLLSDKRVVDAWDFSMNTKVDFETSMKHGTEVTSFIVGEVNNYSNGLATEAELLLAKVFDNSLPNKITEIAWIKALEWAYNGGARLVNSSLGYTGDHHKHKHLVGDLCRMSVAANLAAKKGMLVVNAAGNDAMGNWRRIAFPADADNALTVGAISPLTGTSTAYSSVGPTKNLKLKPNVTALGDVRLPNKKGALYSMTGTSFAAPLVTGFAACLLQLQPSLKPIALKSLIEEVSTLYPYFDYSHGYGVPRAGLYFGTDTFNVDSPIVTLTKSPNYLKDGYYTFNYLEDKYHNTQIFYQILDKSGYIKAYYVASFDQLDDPLKIDFTELEKGDLIRVFHRGTFIETIYK